MLTFLFWNLGGHRRLETLGRLVRRHDVDIVMLAESRKQDPYEIVTELCSVASASFQHHPGLCERVEMFSRFGPQEWAVEPETNRVTMRHLRAYDLLLTVVHLRSKLHQGHAELEQLRVAQMLARDIERMERKVGHQRSLLVGDLNMSPFERPVVAGSGLNATMDRRIAARRSRRIAEVDYPFFYNPMWSLLGDASGRPPGSYFYGESGEIAYYWHTFDQVLLRPALVPMFDSTMLRILDSDGATSFLKKNGTPDANVASDHLPILFRLNCERSNP